MMTYKYVIRNVAYQYGKTVTFMPKTSGLRRQRQRRCTPPGASGETWKPLFMRAISTQDSARWRCGISAAC